ncbi:dapper homolog 1 [Neosynchiropus ocellatus]
MLSGTARRDVAADPVRERLEAAASGISELDQRRRRQEVLVRAVLELREESDPQPLRRSSEEKLLEENILLLRKQLNCLRRRDAGLISQLQELDKQISDLRLDTEASHDQLEVDSRPSSGFYELSDAASGSLSNSSNSVFSECFCSPADGDGRSPYSDELSCLECDGLVGGLCDDLSFSGLVRRSHSAPQPPTLDPASPGAFIDFQSKYQSGLIHHSGSEVFRYPSPLHAVAAQSPNDRLKLGSESKDEGILRIGDIVDAFKPESSPTLGSVSAPHVPQSFSWPPAQTTTLKRLDNYIYGLLQRRAQPIRTGRPRTSISTEPSKSILRQSSMCARQMCGPSYGTALGTLRGPDIKTSWAVAVEHPGISSPQRQFSVESKDDDHDTPNGFHGQSSAISMDLDGERIPQKQIDFSQGDNEDKLIQSNSLLRKKSVDLPSPALNYKDLESPKSTSCLKELKQSYVPAKMQASSLKSRQPDPAKKKALKVSPSSQKHPRDGGERSVLDETYFSSDHAGVKHSKASRKNGRSKSQSSHHGRGPSESRGDKSKHCSKRSWMMEDGGSTYIRVSKRAAAGGARGLSSRYKQLPASIPEGRAVDRHATSTLSSVQSRHRGSRHHHSNGHHTQPHGRDQIVVLAKPKHKRSDYRKVRSVTEAPHEEAQRRHRGEPTSHFEIRDSPYSLMAGSDSEYSAECASLFHSTIVDTSEDERSNYTTNCFGDSESSQEEYLDDTSSTSDTEESVGPSRSGALKSRQKTHPAEAKTTVKIKASHNLKRKILRFRSGSLKLMTTV